MSFVFLFPDGTSQDSEGDPINFAHRGASASAPENTFAAFDRAVSDGADALEIDVRLSADGRVVVIHDETVDRTTNGTGEVASLSLDELEELDAGYRFAREGERPYRGRDLRIPTLKETIERYPEIMLNIEIKSTDRRTARETVRVVSSSGATGRVLLVSERHAVIDEAREASRDLQERVQTGASRREAAVFILMSRIGLASWLAPEYERLQIPPNYSGLDLVTPRLISAASEKGVRVDVWTVNDATQMQRLLNIGVDGIITDRPDELNRIADSSNG